MSSKLNISTSLEAHLKVYEEKQKQDVMFFSAALRIVKDIHMLSKHEFIL